MLPAFIHEACIWSTTKFVLGLTFHLSDASHIHIPALIVWIWSICAVSCSSDIQGVMTPTSPCWTRWIHRRQCYLFQELALWREDHDMTGSIDRHPQITIRTATRVNKACSEWFVMGVRTLEPFHPVPHPSFENQPGFVGSKCSP